MFSVRAQSFWKPLYLTTLLIALGFILGCGKKELTEPEVLAEAQTALAAGDHQTAVTQLESYLADHPGAFDVVDTLAFTYSETGDPAMAAFYFSRAAEIDPSQPEYLLYAARALEQVGDRAGAADSYQKYLTARPGDAGIYVQLAEINQQLGNRSAALDAYLQANRHQPRGETQAAIGRLYLNSGNHAQAQTWFASAAQSEDARQGALLGLLEIALRAERFADAEQLVLTLDLEFPGAIETSALATARTQLRTWRQAQEDATAALTALNDPENRATATPATEDETGDENSVAQPAPTDALRTEPSPPPPGGETLATADSPTVEADAAPMDKNQLVAEVESEIYGPAQLFPEPDERGSGVTEISSSRLRDYEDLLARARAQMANGDYGEAIRNFQRALARNNSDPEVWRDLSEAQFQGGQFSRAPASASEAVRRAPDDPGFLLQYLRVAQRTLPQSTLVRELEAARNRFPRSGSVALALARAYDAQGSRGYAGRMFREFLRLAPPDHPDRAEIEALLNN